MMPASDWNASFQTAEESSTSKAMPSGIARLRLPDEELGQPPGARGRVYAAGRDTLRASSSTNRCRTADLDIAVGSHGRLHRADRVTKIT